MNIIELIQLYPISFALLLGIVLGYLMGTNTLTKFLTKRKKDD